MFSTDHLLQQLRAVCDRPVCIAYSGGLDSSVLLYACVQLRDAGSLPALRALHVHHGLQGEADQWVRHCQEVCESMNVPLQVVRLQPPGGCDAGQNVNMGPEATARAARYEVFERELAPGEVLLQAHHLDDQAETFLLRALRGAGARGLAGIPATRKLGPAQLVRPLLDWRRAELEDWAGKNQVRHIVDASNEDPRYDRNFLRHQVLPLLEQRWPGAARSLAGSADLCTVSDVLVSGLAAGKLATCLTASGNLRWKLILPEEPTLQAEMIRLWIRELGLPAPDAQALRRVLNEVLTARSDGTPLVCWANVELRRYRDTLYATSPLPKPPPATCWDGAQALDLGPGCGVLHLQAGSGPGLDPTLLSSARLSVAFRVAGARCRPAGRVGTHPLKKLFQEYAVPPWLRERWPVLVYEGEIVAVAGLFYCHSFVVKDAAKTWQLQWQPSGALKGDLEGIKFMNICSPD